MKVPGRGRKEQEVVGGSEKRDGGRGGRGREGVTGNENKCMSSQLVIKILIMKLLL